MCIPAFYITPSWPPFSVSVRLIENRLTEIFSVNRLTENIPNFFAFLLHTNTQLATAICSVQLCNTKTPPIYTLIIKSSTNREKNYLEIINKAEVSIKAKTKARVK